MIAYLSLTCLLAVGCTASVIPDSKEIKMAHASNDLAFNLLRSYRNEKNVIISPFSISTALAMVYAGARGTTAEAMRNVLKYDQYGLSEQEILEAFKTITDNTKQSSEDYQFSSYNSAFIQQSFNVTHSYQDALRQYFSAEIVSVDFEHHGEQIKDRINGAAENATHGKIKELLSSPPDPSAKLFLLNAAYFLGQWRSPFSPESITEDTFYNNGVEEKTVQMMNRDGEYAFSLRNDLNSTVVLLPYKGENSAHMVILLPNERNKISELEERITQESLDAALVTAFQERAYLSVPKFNLSYSANMVDSLTTLGLEELFSDRADLTGIAGVLNGLKVSKVLHKSVINVDEKGSEAAGATGVEILPESVPTFISVNHPFLVVIREESSGMILFLGRVDQL